jgi:hypothetical protein
MKTLNIFLRIIILIILSNSALFSQLELTTYSDKDVYEYGETIELFCKVTNTADTTFEFFAPTYQSCQAEFSFNDFNSWEYTACLTLTELLTFEPHASKIYSWKIEPKSFGLPNKEGTQTIIGKYYFDLADTIYIQAPKFVGGEIALSYHVDNFDSVAVIRESLNADVVFGSDYGDIKDEVWQIEGYDIDSLIQIYSNNPIFITFEKSIWIMYENIVDENQLDYYPLQVGNYWQYIVEKRGVFPSDSADWIAYTEVIGDTTMPNGNKYFVLNEKGMSIYNQPTYKKYIRIDSSKANVYEYRYDEEFLIDSLQMEVGDEFDCLGLADIYFKDVFGINTQIRYYHQTCVTTTGSFNYELAKDFGKIHSVITETNVYAIDFKFDLVYAKINEKEYGKLVDVNYEDNFPKIPSNFSLFQNYPNPFNPSTTIEYTVPSSTVISNPLAGERSLETKISPVGRNDNSNVTLIVYDILGRKVNTLVNQPQNPGRYSVQFNSSNLASGIYYYQIKFGSFVKTKKMILLR